MHSIGAALFARKDQIHFFDDIGYRHEPFQVRTALILRLSVDLRSTARKAKRTPGGNVGVTSVTTLTGNGEQICDWFVRFG